MTEPRKISEVPLRLIDGTGSKGPLTAAFPDLDLMTLPARLDDTTLAQVEVIANSPLPALSRCDDGHFLKCMRSLAILPKRADSETSGELRTALYQRMLGHLSHDAISFLTENALATCQWFPTIAECNTIVARWQRNDAAVQRRARAEGRARAERQARFDEAMDALAGRTLDQLAIDALPERWKAIAAERCYLWRHPDGTYTVRPDR